MTRLNNTTALSAIILDEINPQVTNEHQVLRVGKFKHPTYGYFEITPEVLLGMKQNFDNKIRGIDISWDYYHKADEEAAAWVNQLQLRNDNTELWAIVSWTPKAKQMLMEREIRYFSPDFAFEWMDPESLITYKNVLFGGGLTNRPFVKEMQAIVADEFNNKGVKMDPKEMQKEIEKLQSEVKQLSEDKIALEKKMADMQPPSAEEDNEIMVLKKQIADLQAQLEQAMKDKEAMMGEVQKMQEAKALAERESEFNILLSEGKACVAQKESYLKQDMKEFIKLAQPLNMKPSGSSENLDITENEKIKSILKLAEEKRKLNPKLDHAESISLAKKEIEKK